MASFVHRVRSLFDRDRVQYRPLVDDNESGRNRPRLGSRQQNRRGLPLDTGRGEERPVGGVWARGNRPLLKLSMVVVGLAMVMYLGVAFSRGGGPSCDTPDHGYQCYPSVARQWGQYAPFFSVPSDIKAAETASLDEAASGETAHATALPPQCHYTFALVLSRHGGRDPTAGKSAAYGELVRHIQASVEEFANGPDGQFAFLDRYTYRMGADQLTRFGELEMVHSGAHFYNRYRSLILSAGGGGEAADHEDDEEEEEASLSYNKPFVRAAGQHRVIMSAVNWVRGFHRARLDDSSTTGSRARGHPDQADSPSLENDQSMVIIPEESGFNNTLSYNGLCRRFSSRNGYYAQRAFAGVFVPPITARLNRGLPGANLTDRDTIALMDLCPFETIADDDGLPEGGGGGTAGRRLSPFCHLFSESEWRDYDYYQTLGKWYGYGDGSALGAAQGIGFVNELIARLTASPVADRTSVNHTLDADPATFPLDAAVYADFSHDNDMANVFAAMGLYNRTTAAGQHAPLQPSNMTRTEPQDMMGYAASWTVPFAARMYVEKMRCDGDEEDLVRVLVNDRVVPLQRCGSDELGRCRLGRFVESLAFARSGGNWDECFA